MDVGIFYEIQVASPLKHREREYQVFHQVLDQVVAAEQAGFDSFWTVEHHVSTPVLEARKSGRSREEITSDRPREIKEYEGLDPRKVDLQFLIDNGMCVAGDPDTCIKQIERIQQAANLDLFLCMMQF